MKVTILAHDGDVHWKEVYQSETEGDDGCTNVVIEKNGRKYIVGEKNDCIFIAPCTTDGDVDKNAEWTFFQTPDYSKAREYWDRVIERDTV